MKNYEPQKFTVEKDSLELNKNCSSFFIPITCTDFNFVKKPRLFVRGDGNALLRINIYHYNPVKIPREYIRQIRYTIRRRDVDRKIVGKYMSHVPRKAAIATHIPVP